MRMETEWPTVKTVARPNRGAPVIAVVVWLAGFGAIGSAAAVDAATGYTWSVQLEMTELASARDTAIQRVQEKAADQVANWLRQVWPDASWTPTPQFLRERRIIYDVYAESRILELPEGQRVMFAGVAQCRLTTENWRELLERVRCVESERRLQRLAWYVLLPATVLLVVVWLFHGRNHEQQASVSRGES